LLSLATRLKSFCSISNTYLTAELCTESEGLGNFSYPKEN